MIYIYVSTEYKNQKNRKYIRKNLKYLIAARNTLNSKNKALNILSGNRAKTYPEVKFEIDRLQMYEIKEYLYLVDKCIWEINNFLNRTSANFENNLAMTRREKEVNNALRSIRTIILTRKNISMESFNDRGNIDIQKVEKLKSELDSIISLTKKIKA